MPRDEWDGSERYDDGGEPEGPSGIPWPGSNRLFTLGAERDGASVSVTMSMARDDGHTEAMPVPRVVPGSRRTRGDQDPPPPSCLAQSTEERIALQQRSRVPSCRYSITDEHFRRTSHRLSKALTTGSAHSHQDVSLSIGNGALELNNDLKRIAFELHRTNSKDVELITYDEQFRKLEVLASLFSLTRPKQK